MTPAEMNVPEDEAKLRTALDSLLSEHDPAATDPVQFRGFQYDRGLAWVHFPEGFGGLDLAPALQHVVDEELSSAGVPPAEDTLFFGLTLVAPTMVTHGSDEIRHRLLRRIFTGEDKWCQLFSEPGAGSDLAGLACRAVQDGDEWVVTGQKVWNTLAHLADRGMLLARTDPNVPKHKGITYFALDMHSPGVTVRPLRQITGQAEFNEVFFEEVRIPDTDRIGGTGDGWRVAMTTLMNERTTIGGSGAGGRPSRGSGAIAEALRIWQQRTDKPVVLRDRLARLWIEAEVLRLTNVRAGQALRSGNPGPEGSIAKLSFAEVNKKIYELCVDLLGPAGAIDYDFGMRRADVIGLVGPPGSGRAMFLRSRANSIEGGTSEIQRNILGEQVLGLPPEPRLDKDVPWSEVPRG